jgi:endonuclease/exonuclease/phosphatase family metal-dependent hydrolase
VDGDGELRVLTWNLWWRFGPAWRERQPHIRDTLRAVDPDIAALQEVWGADGTSQAHELADALGHHAAYAEPSLPPPPDGPEHAGVEVGLGLVSRWPIGSWEAVRMPARYRKPTVTLRATVEHPAGPLHVLVACLEWEPAFQEDRHAQARRLARLAADPALDGPAPVVVAGDLNAAPDSPVLRPLPVAGLVDAWSAAGGDPTAVTLSSGHPQAPLEAVELIDRRIDHVFARPGHPGQKLRFERAVLAGDVNASDHHAVVCDIAW